MTIAEQIRQIMHVEGLSDAEKLDSFHALIPPETFKIDSRITATPEQMRQLRDGVAVSSAMQQIRRAGLMARQTGRNQISQQLGGQSASYRSDPITNGFPFRLISF